MPAYPMTVQARAQAIPFYEYFTIKDQSGVSWYWWVTSSRDIAWGTSLLSYPHRQSRALLVSPIPSWITVVDTTAVTRYVYPKTLTGELLVMPSAPAVGTGYPGSVLLLTMLIPYYATFGATPVQEAITYVG